MVYSQNGELLSNEKEHSTIATHKFNVVQKKQNQKIQLVCFLLHKVQKQKKLQWDMGALLPPGYYSSTCIVLHGWENPSSSKLTLCVVSVYIIYFKSSSESTGSLKMDQLYSINYISMDLLFLKECPGRKYTKILKIVICGR